MFFQSNIQFLRKRIKRTQEDVAAELGIKRTNINNYENGYSQPSLDMLPFFSKYYRLSIDTLINVDLTRLSESQLLDLESDFDSHTKGSKLRVLVTTIDNHNRENIELVPIRARAGYTAGYNDPVFIQSLPSFQLPFLASERTYRTFQISGDSMLPIPDKSYVTTEYVTNWNDIKDGQAYVVLTEDDGIVFKVLYKPTGRKKTLLLRSLNPAFEPYEIKIESVKELWRFVNYISPQLPDAIPLNNDLTSEIINLRDEVFKLRTAVAGHLPGKKPE